MVRLPVPDGYFLHFPGKIDVACCVLKEKLYFQQVSETNSNTAIHEW